ncbi:muscle-specific protein 300 kDa isoform X18 [Tribolium castaneum]|uniref:muscle-specific protein 300 kDa isoform X18 n=1 Tax=Tribolium castaneum TaxID=7070 RepID=UPI0030FE6F7B
MSASDKEEPKRPPDSPTTPPGQRLRERVSFFEKVWSGGKSGVVETVSSVDVEEFERRLAEERLRNAERGRLEPVALRHTPRHVVHTHEVRPDGSIQETVTTTTEEGDLGSGVKTVKFEKVTVRKSVRTVSSRTPSEELLLEDSAYLTQSNGNLATSSKTSSISSLTGRFPSEESLRRTPSRERLNRDEWDNASNSSKVTSSSSEWYSEYRTQSFQSGSSKLEYVRSKSQYDEHIASIRDEQERVQKKTFVNWINSYLSKRVPPLRVDDLIDDLKDGTKLLALLEVLSGEKLPVERGRILRRPHFLSNANTALEFLTRKRIKLVNINASDLVDGRPPVVLGLIWTIILYFQIEENTRALQYLAHWDSSSSLESAGTSSSKDKWKLGARKTLLQWVSNALPTDSGIEIKDFGSSWRDGIAFLAIIDAIKKNLVNIAELKKASNRTRLETAFDVAENELGITRLLDPEDVDVPKPDERSIMTYVAQFLHKYPEPKSTGPDAIAAIQEEYSQLLSWLMKKTQYLEHLQQTNSLPNDYSEYQAFKSEVDAKEKVFLKLKRLIESQSLISITKESWYDITKLWDKLQNQLLYWLWMLDSLLPGDLKFVGEWLAKAEKLLYCDEIPTIMNEETASIISRKLEEHKAFFADLPTVQEKFAQACKAPLSEVPSEQLQNMAVRLNEVGPKAAQRRVRLKFLEHKCCLIAFLQLTETKLKAWSGKYGRLEKVVQILEQYRNFVSKNHIFQEFNKAFIDMQAVVEEYKRDGGIDKREMADIDRFLRDTADRWKNVSMELRCVQSMIEEVVAYWRRWDSLSGEFDEWLNKAEKAINLPEEEKMEFFQDISVWRDNYQLLGDTVSFLIATCEDKIAVELKIRYQNMTDRWEKLYPQVNKYSHAGDLLRNRKDFRAGVDILSEWLRKAETVLNSPQLGSTERIKKHIENLMKLQGEVEEIENLFKNVSKTFQTLIQDLTREEVDKMMLILKHEKESLVKVRALLPAQIHMYNQLLVQQESLEAGQKEISNWLDNAESLLSSLSLEAEKDTLKDQLDKLKQFFTRTLYYKSMLDSKNKVLANIVKSVDQTDNVDVAQMSAKMEQLNDRFVYVTQNAQLWEQRLQEAIRCWFNFSECERVISNWLNNAEKLIGEKRIDNKETVEEHKNFFQSVNERWIHDLVQSAQDLCNCLPKEQHKPILASVHQLQNKWREILSFAPLHLMRLEFRLDESAFNYYVKEIEKEITTEYIAFSKQENIESILSRNKEFFGAQGPLAETSRCLENLRKIAATYTQHHPGDKSIVESFAKAEEQWQGLNTKVETLRQQLDQIPQKWEHYNTRFDVMVKWMDEVDNTLRNIFNDVNTMEEFEREKAIFQNICKEADSKREDMKWLVQTLDSLASHCPESQALTEQKKLEALITRYKNLIPSLEVTMVKTETLSKCYTYRRDVKEVCSLLKRVRDQSQREAQPQSLDSVNELIKHQEIAISQLDQQRPHIMSMLQKGKELVKDTNAPPFVQEEVKVLESGWTETYDETVERYHKLLGTQHLWFNYSEQKQEILDLLHRAEQELKRISPSQYNSSNLPAELLAKQEMAVRLREATEEMLRRLRDLSRNLGVTDQKIEKEVTEIEQRLNTTLENVQEKVVFLEQYNTKWSNFQNKLGELQNWSVQSAPQLLSAVQEDNLPPEERVTKTTLLQSELCHKINLLDQLNAEASTLMIGDNPDVKQLQAQVSELQERVVTINRNVESQAASITKDLKNWQVYQASIQDIKPWIEKSEHRIQVGAPKPASLEEALILQRENKDFAKECDSQFGKIQNVAGLSQQITSKTNAPDEIDSIHSRWTIINETTHQWGQKLEKLVHTWEDFDKNAKNLENWIEKSGRVLSERSVNLNTPHVDKLEKELAKLKAFNNEVSEQQAKVIALTQSADSISHHVNPEGATLVKGKVQELKAQVGQLAEAVRAKINQVSDAILTKHDFQTKMVDFSNWVDQLKSHVGQIDQIPADKVETALINVHDLMQQHSEKQPVFNTIYNEIKEITLKASPDEAQSLNQEYTALVESYQEVDDKLKNKKLALEKWGDLINWHGETINQLSHIKYQIDSGKVPPDNLQKLLQETEGIISKITTWKQTAPEIDNMDVIILDRQTGLPRSADQLVREVEVRAINIKQQLADKLDNVQKVKAHWRQFEELLNRVKDSLGQTEAQLGDILKSVKTSHDLPQAVDQLNQLLEAQIEKSPIKEELRKEALQLMKEDIQNVSLIQNAISEVETSWNRVNEDIKEQKLKLSDTIFAWTDFKEAKDRVIKDIERIEQTVEGLEVPNDLIQANMNSEKARKALDSLKKIKTNLDRVDLKGQAIVKKADLLPGTESEVRSEVQEVHQVWSRVYEKLMKIAQTTESQATIWKHIEDTKNSLLQWLGEQNMILALAVEKPNEVEAAKAKLARYREELPAQQRLSQSVPTKYAQLVKLTDGRDIPTLQSLMQLLEDQFRDVEANAQKLELVASKYGDKESQIRESIKSVGAKVTNLREGIIKCEDLSGDNAKILDRLLTVRQLKSQVMASEADIKKIDGEIQQMKASYPSFSESNLPKEQQLLRKRFESVIVHGSKIENSLLTFLKKFHNEKYGALQRIIATHKEKIQWCLPEPASDKYNLEVKLKSLVPIQNALEDCEARRKELEESLSLLEKVESPETIKLLTAEKDHLFLDLDDLKESYNKTKALLERNIILHEQYEKLSDSISNWLKEIENRVKTESTTQTDLNTVDAKIAEIEKLKSEVVGYESEIGKLVPLSEQLVKEVPESRVGQYAQHLTTRYQTVAKFLTSYLDKLNELNRYKDLYRKSIKDVENWLVQAEEKVKTFSDFTTRPNQATLQELKSFANEKELGQVLLAKAVEHGEALFSGITPENRDAIRAELRNLRDKSEGLIDKVNNIYKQVEGILIQRHSFDDNLQQVRIWIEDAETKLGPEMKLDATLAEKKQTLHNYKTLAQDVNLHKTILKQLQEKIGQLADADAENSLEENLDKYNRLAEEVDSRIGLVEDFVANHEAYNQAIEKCHDWLSALTSEAALLVDESSTEPPEAKLAMVENLLAQKPEGDKIIDSCKQQLEVVLKQTSSPGHPHLIHCFEEQEKSWKHFLDLCSDAQEKLQSIHSKYAEVEKLIQNLDSWLKQKEGQAKDQSLKSTEETKRGHLDKLLSLEKEVLGREKDFGEVAELAKNLEGDVKVSQLLTRYQALKNLLKEAINRYRGFVNEHQNFNEEYATFLYWLTEKGEELSDLSHIVGDLDVLQTRQKDIKDLIEARNLKSEQFENLIENGEKLYAHTSPDGREIIRQQLRNLRTIWDSFSDDLQNATNKLDQCLVQFSDFSSTQEQLTKWLKDVEKAMQQHTELKTTLQEKRAQLQNHKIMHQEIMSHQQLVESVCDKAQQLVDQTQDRSLNVYLQSIKQLFLSIVSKSEELLTNLEDCVEKHSQYNQQVAAFKDWLSEQAEKLQEYNVVNGEKSELAKRISSVKNLKERNETEGSKLLESLKQNFIVVAKSTAPKGVELLKKELEELYGMLNQHLEDMDTIVEKQENAIKQWQQFETELETLNQWFKNAEVKFRDQSLRATLQEKENQLKTYLTDREQVAAKEKEIDHFVDKSHSLLHMSGVQRIKPLVSQISTRYQNLHASTKDVINRWQSVVDDHQKYQKKLEETSNWLKHLEDNLAVLQNGELATNLEAITNRLQVLLGEKDQGEHKINSLTLLGERILPDTATQGREIIRNELREIRERWDRLAEGIKEQQKLQDAQSLQLSSYQDMLQQTLAWLDTMEKQIQVDPSTWVSIQEVRSKLLKHRTIHQEIVSHKRIIDGVTEKAQTLVQLTNNKDKTAEVEESINSINERYKKLLQAVQNNLKQLENCLEVYQQFYDLQKAHQDNQKQLWDKLNSYSDLSGNKQALQERLDNVIDIQEHLPESSIKLKELQDHVDSKISVLPGRAQENMHRDVANLKFDQEKFVAALVDIRSGLEGRLKLWSDYEESLERLLSWLADAELALKNYTLKNTLEEKQEQLEKYQALILNLRQNETEFHKMSDDSTELLQSSGDSRISVNVQQISSRFQSVQATAKEVVKKCEQNVADHKLYNDKYRQCSDWIAVAQGHFDTCKENIKKGARNVLTEQYKILEELLSQQTSATLLLNNTIELGEKLYLSTGSEGREVISTQLQELQQAFETLFDGINNTDRELKAKLTRWTGFEECAKNIRTWLKEADLGQELELKATLDEKRAQLQVYRTLLHDALAHQQDVVDLRDKVESLPERNDSIDQQLATIIEQHDKLLKRAQNFVERYESIVSDHQEFSKVVTDTKEWMAATLNTVNTLGDLDLERISLHSNLERLKSLKNSLPEEENRIEKIKSLGSRVIPGTIDYGQTAIRTQIDNSQEEWAGLVSAIDQTISQLESKLEHWSEYETLKDQCLAWIREVDNKLHSIDLKATAAQKKAQLEALKTLQGEIRAKELEIDAVTEKAQQVNKGLCGRNSQISELGVKYQQVSHKVKELTSRWQQYVNSHQDFDSKISSCEQWLGDINDKLTYCSDIGSSNQKELEAKLETVQELLLSKEEGFAKIQNLVELAQTVLANTSPNGHNAINESLANIQELWSNLASRMIETKALIDDALTKWAGLLEQIRDFDKTVEWMEGQLKELSTLQATAAEKKTQLDQIKNVEEKVRCEKIEIDNLKAMASQVFRSKKAAQVDAQKVFDRFDECAKKITKLLQDRENQYRDHKTYKESYDEVQRWMTRAQEKVPQLKQRPLGEKLTIENFSGPLDHLLNKQAQGEVLLENLEHAAQVVLPNTNPQGQELIKKDIKALRESFERLFKDLQQQRDQLEVVLQYWRDYKDDYERISDWLQQIAILIKNQKIALFATLPEKVKQVSDVKDILKKLDDGKVQIDQLNDSAKILLKSPLEIHVNNQLQQLNSRYQVELNLAKDVLKKVETNRDQHQEYSDNLEKSRKWIDEARELIRNCSEAASHSSKDVLQSHLNKIQELIQRREEGQNLIHATVNCGEKVLRSTRSDGREAINNELKEIQGDWDRIVKKMSTVKVHLETALLQWADYDSSYSQLQQWITDREAKLQQVSEQKVVKTKKTQTGLSSLPIGERKATLRETGSIVQDIVSFEPMIQSVTSKAEDLKQAAPASEISTKYETLSKHAKELYEKQKETVEQHQAFVDADNDFVQWIRLAKERLSKCSEPTGDKESLGSKLSQLKALQNELPEGEKKLETALEQGDKACQYADEEDREIIEEEVGLLQEEFDNYVDSLNSTKNLLEIGIVKWTEYEEQYQEALDWLAQTENLVQSYNRLQDSLEEKRAVLEQFQLQLQTLFDWQSELDRLNMKAQVLLETCADTRISNAVTQLSTKYNAILSLAKEVMRRLELHYQEHQQHSTLYQECQDWIDRTRDKLHTCQEVPNTLPEVNSKLQAVKNIRTSLEQGQNKLRYISELKERVIMNTEQSGAAKIQEDTENLKQDMEKLLNEVQEARNRLTNRASQLEEIAKLHMLLLDWLQDIEHQVQSDDEFLNDLSEKKAKLEKFKAVQKEIKTHTDLIEKLKAKLAEDSSLKADEYENSFKKYEALKQSVAKSIADLEKQVGDHEQYKNSYNVAMELIRKSCVEAQTCSDLHDELDKILEKEAKISEIASSLPECDNLVHKTIELSILVMKTTGEEGKDTIKQEIEQLNMDWEGLHLICNETQKSITRCKDAWKEFKTNFDKMKKCIDNFQKRVDGENEKEKKTPEDLDRCKQLLAEIVAEKPNLEILTDSCEALMELSAVGWVRDKTVQLQTAYTNLLTNCQTLVSKIEKNLSDHTEFLKVKKELETWLHSAHKSVQDCIGVGDEDTIREKLETIRVISAKTPEGQVLLTKLQDAFSKAINTTPADKQDGLREDMTSLRNSWDQLNMDLTSIQAQLKAALARWDDYNETKRRLQDWLSQTERILKEKPHTKGELSEMKTLLERYKNLQVEIKNKQGDLNRLKDEAVELSSWAKQPKVLEEVKQLQTLYDNLSTLCDAQKERIEAEMLEYNNYHQSLQETEKWLLQISFQLMAHNSLYITNREQTEEQLTQHEILLKEIQNYQKTLDDVKGKGHGQIERYVKEAPAIKDTIEKQLSNVQDSYNSLLQTAVQIKNRLVDSLAKFKEYEDTLESIMKNLDEYEPIVTEEVEKEAETLEEALSQLETAKSLHNKLQNEKSRLALAVQACEAATASISRPSSPRDTLPPPVPIKELECRARLEDLIDQTHQESASALQMLVDELNVRGFTKKLHDQIDKVQSHLSNLTTSVAEFEEKEKHRDALKDWIINQKNIVVEWKNRPTKLRADAAKQELSNMNDLMAAIDQRRTQLVTEFASPKNAHLEQMLDDLENELSAAIASKTANQEILDEYRQNVQVINNWFDNLVKRIDAIDRGSGLNCQQKQVAIEELKAEFEDQGPKRMNEVKRFASQVLEFVNNLDAQQVEEQMKSIERRNNDIGKRLQRKLQILDMTRKGIEDTRNEIEQARDWVKARLIELQKPPLLGFESRKAEDRLNSLKGLLKEADNKLVLKETLMKRVSNMTNELEPPEREQLETALKNLGLEQEQLVERIKSAIERVNGAANTRRTLESNLEKARAWLKAKNADVHKLSGYLPLKSRQVEEEIAQHRIYESEIKTFSDGDLNDLLKLGNSVLKECDESDRERLQTLLDEVKDEHETLKSDSLQKINALSDLLQGRKQFESDIDKCIDWLKQAEVATASDIRAPNIEVLEEQLAKYETLGNEAKRVQTDIDKIFEQAKAIVPTISESDKIYLNEVLNNMRDRHNRISALIQDRTNALKANIQQLREAQSRIAESVQFVNEIQNQLKELNKPIGSKVEDVQNVLSSYERILGDLKANKARLGDVPASHSSELQSVLATQDDLIKSIEDQIARLRQLLLLREQFIALITEIMTFITKYTEIVRDIERSGGTIEDKIKKYDDVIVKIQECEAMLASAADKGQQIAADCSVQDRNSITEQIQSLKQSLQNLRRAVEKQRQEHENTAAEHRKLAAELESILDWLHANEGAVRSRPLLSRDVQSVDQELENHERLARNVGEYLDKIRKIQEATRHDDSMPGSLLEQLSEGNSLLASLPRELDEREKYLTSNKQLREEYARLKQRLNEWVKEAEIRLASHKDGVDFENILTDLEEHKIFFSTEGNMKELVSVNLQQVADKIWPSLTPYEQEELSREQQYNTQLLKNTLNSAKSQKAQLEQDAEIWKDYCQTLDKVKAVIARTKFTDEPVTTLAGLHFNIQKISHALNDIQNQQLELDLLLERSNEIIKHADDRNKLKTQEQTSQVSDEWTSLVSNLENRRGTLTKLAQVWETFEGRWQHFESLLSGVEERAKHVDNVVRSKEHVIATNNSILELQSEAESLKKFRDEVFELSENVLLFLKECSQTSATALNEKLKQLRETYQRLLDSLDAKLQKTEDDLREIVEALDCVAREKTELNKVKLEVENFYVFDANLDRTEGQLKQLRSKVASCTGRAKELSSRLKDKYLKSQQLVPSDVAQELNQLELLTEALASAMEEKDREFKKAKTVRSDYLNDVEEVQSWIKDAELKVQDRSIEPQLLQQHLQTIQAEIGGITDRLEKLIKNGKLIVEKTKDDDEKQLIQSTINNLSDQLQQVRSWLEEKRQQVGETLDAWQRFLSLYQTVMTWVQEKRVFLKEPLYITTLTEARQKLHDYSNAVKSCKTASKNLSEMAKELEHIGSVTSVGDLPTKMEEAEEAKTEVEASILERNALLQETSEEWEQCEKKMKDVRGWIEKTTTTLDSQQNKKKPLRDQHALCEKMLADIQIQKTKISLSVEKLQLHFRSGVGGDTRVTQSAQELLKELDDLNGNIKEQSSRLETAIAQVEQYQLEVQQLRQQIVQVEQQLRAAMAPTHLPHDRDQAVRDQQACRDRVRALQNKMAARNERIKLILQRGVPDSEPLDT